MFRIDNEGTSLQCYIVKIIQIQLGFNISIICWSSTNYYTYLEYHFKIALGMR
jgi:hypothetical protein